MRYAATIILLISTFASARTKEPTPSAAHRMIEQLKSRDWILQAEALDYLSRYEVPGVAPRIKAVLENRRANRWLRGRALVALSRIDAKSAAALADKYSKGGSWELRAAVAEICAGLSKDKAAPIIKRLLAERTPQVRLNALAVHAQHNGRAAWKMVERMTAKIPDNCIEPASRALAWTGTDEARARLLTFSQKSSSIPAMLRGMRPVTKADLIPVYLEIIAFAPQQHVLAEAWVALERHDRGALVAACMQALASRDERRVRGIMRIMAQYLKDRKLESALKDALRHSKDRATLLLGLTSLSSINADGFSEFFVSHLTHKDAAVRRTAVQCLAQTKDVNLYDSLEKVLRDSDKTVALAAFGALRRSPTEHVPQARLIEYFTPSLLSPDAAIRKIAVEVMSASVTKANAEAALAMMRRMQSKFGVADTEPLMKAVFNVTPEDEAVNVLITSGYVSRWHVIGAFPSGFGVPVKNADGFATVYPPEKKVDLNESITVKYNLNGDTRFARKPAQKVIQWVEATIGSADGILFLTRGTRSELTMPRKHGVNYAYTEIGMPKKTDIRMTAMVDKKARIKIWLNGKPLKFDKSVAGKLKGMLLKTLDVTLVSGNNKILVKVLSNEYSGAWWAVPGSARWFRMGLTDREGKPVEWSDE